MKHLIKLIFLCLSLSIISSSCSKDEDNISLDKNTIVGTWDVVWAEQDGKSINVPEGYIYITLKDDGSYKTVMFSDYYIGNYKIDGNTVVGTTVDPITEYYKFTSLEGNNASIDYSNSVGEIYKFRAIKR